MATAILIAPKFDEATTYSYEWSREVKQLLESKGYQVIDLSGGTVSRKEVEKSIADVDLFIFYNHGSEDALWGSRTEAVIDLKNAKLLSGKETYTMACIPKGYHVYTNEGIKDIAEVKVGDYVLSHNGTFDKVIATFKREYRGKIVTILPKVLNLPLKLTPDHPVLVCRPKVKKKPHYGETDPEKWRLKWIQAGKVKKGDYVVFPIPKFEDDKFAKSFLEAFASSEKISEFMELAGFYVAEGDAVGNQGIRFSFGRDEKGRINRVRELIIELFNKEPTITNQSTATTVKMGDYILSRLFKRWFGRKARLKRIPMWIITLHKEYLKPFLKGLFAGDGSIYTHHFTESKGYDVISYGTSSEILMHQLLFILSRFEIVPTISIERQRKWGKRPKYTLTMRGGNMVKLAELLDAEVSKPKQLHNHAFTYEGYIWMRVKDVRYEQFNGYVYNMEVEGSNSYVCEGIAVHNCLSAKKLGVEAYKNNSTAYWGYVAEFTFTTDATEEFKAFANCGIKFRLEGKSWEESLELAKQLAKKLVDELVKAGKYIASVALQSDADALRCYTQNNPPTESGCFFRRLALKIFGLKLGWRLSKKTALGWSLYWLSLIIMLHDFVHECWLYGGYKEILSFQGFYIGFALNVLAFIVLSWEFVKWLKSK